MQLSRMVSEFGQDYLSEASYSAVVDLMLCYVYTGTPAAVNRYMDKAAIEGGSVTRTILCNVNSQLGENQIGRASCRERV